MSMSSGGTMLNNDIFVIESKPYIDAQCLSKYLSDFMYTIKNQEIYVFNRKSYDDEEKVNYDIPLGNSVNRKISTIYQFGITDNYIAMKFILEWLFSQKYAYGHVAEDKIWKIKGGARDNDVDKRGRDRKKYLSKFKQWLVNN
jgi:hypothetical protein